MNMYMPANVFWGERALLENAGELKSLGKKCLIVTGGSSARISGALDDAQKALSENGIDFSVFSKIGPNPLLSVCHEAGCEARNIHADFIFGIGGGSVLDASKAVAIYAANPDFLPEDIYKREYRNSPLPVALVGTTSGTGSEVTGVSVLTNDRTGRKKSISGRDCYAALVFADPMYTATMPEKVAVSTGLDAFSHAVEGWFTPKMNEFVKMFAVKGLPLIWDGLCRFAEGENSGGKLCENMYYGSLLAGLVINTCGTAFPHPLGYVLTENYGVPHGQACAAFLPAFFERAAEYEPQKLAELEKLLGCGKREITEILKKLSVTGDIVISSAAAQRYAERWNDNVPKNFAASPGGLSPEEAARLLIFNAD